jgi:hypothetical protein
LGLPKGQEPYAYAAVCRFEEFEKGNPSISTHDYRRLRTELADLFYLPSSDFTIRDLLRTPFGAGGEPFGSLEGVNVPPSHGSSDGSGAG